MNVRVIWLRHRSPHCSLGVHYDDLAVPFLPKPHARWKRMRSPRWMTIHQWTSSCTPSKMRWQTNTKTLKYRHNLLFMWGLKQLQVKAGLSYRWSEEHWQEKLLYGQTLKCFCCLTEDRGNVHEPQNTKTVLWCHRKYSLSPKCFCCISPISSPVSLVMDTVLLH